MARAPLTRERAEAIAAEALVFIAEEPERLGRFIALAGLSPDELRKQVQAPAFLGGVLDFLLGEEALVLAFAERLNVPPKTPGQARRLLP